MVIGVLLSGIVSGLAMTLGALMMGLPLWLAVLLYPVVGAFGAVAFIGFVFTVGKMGVTDVSPTFAAEYN